VSDTPYSEETYRQRFLMLSSQYCRDIDDAEEIVDDLELRVKEVTAQNEALVEALEEVEGTLSNYTTSEGAAKMIRIIKQALANHRGKG